MNDTALQDRRGAGRTVLVLSAVLTLLVVGAVALLLRTDVLGGDVSAPTEGPHDQPITARAVAGQVWDHLDHTELGAATGHDEVSESGDEEIHLAMWSVLESQDFLVAVAKDDDLEGRPSTCRAVREQSRAVRSCEEIESGGTTVLWFSSTENPIGDNMGGDGLTWTAFRADADQVVSASIMLSDVGSEPGRESGEDLPMSKDRMVDIVADPDLAILTTREAIDAGKALDDQQWTTHPDRDDPATE